MEQSSIIYNDEVAKYFISNIGSDDCWWLFLLEKDKFINGRL